MADDLRLLPCPMCGGSPRLVDLAGWEILCKCGVDMCLETPEEGPLIEAWNRRAAPSSPVADDGLPPLPEPDLCIDASDKWWCEESVRQAQREAFEAGRSAGARENCRCSEKVQMVQEQQPSTVLELIAEVERLSAALEARIEEGKDNA